MIYAYLIIAFVGIPVASTLPECQDECSKPLLSACGNTCPFQLLSRVSALDGSTIAVSTFYRHDFVLKHLVSRRDATTMPVRATKCKRFRTSNHKNVISSTIRITRHQTGITCFARRLASLPSGVQLFPVFTFYVVYSIAVPIILCVRE